MAKPKTHPERMLPLTPAVFHVLLALAGGERHGYAIMQEVATSTEGRIKMGPGTLYGTIKRLLEAKLIEESDERPDPHLDDERRRYYRLTAVGEQVVRAEARRYSEIVALARGKEIDWHDRARFRAGRLRMKNEHPSRGFLISQGVYERLLVAYPRRHRNDYGAAMAQLFRDQCRDAWDESGNWGMLKLWLRILPDLASTSILERLATLNERKTMSDKLANLFSFRAAPLANFLKIFAVVVFLTVLVSVIITCLLPESYASTARIKVENDADNQPAAYDPYFIQTTLEIIQSDLVIERVVENLKLDVAWGKKYSIGEKLKMAESVQLLRQRLQLAPVRNTALISITVYSDDKKEASDIANAVAAAYRDYRFESRRLLDETNLKALREQYQEQDFQIREAQKGLDALRQKADSSNEVSARQRDLDYLLDFHKALFAKMEQRKLDAELPKLNLVQITDTAQPGRGPVRPNKTMNIFIGAAAGILLGAAIGMTCVVLGFVFGKRSHGVANAAQASP